MAIGRPDKALTILPWEHGDALQEERPANGTRTTAGCRLILFRRNWWIYTVRGRDLLPDRPPSPPPALGPAASPSSHHPGACRAPLRPPPGRQQGSASPRQRARPCPAPLTPRRAHRSHTSGTRMERGRRGPPPGPPPPTEPGAQPGNTWRGPEIASRVGGAAQARGQRPLQGGFGGPQGRVVSWEGAGAFSCVSWRPLRG